MSDIEDGELLSSDNEDINQLPSKEDKKHKSKHKDKNHLDTNNNLHDNVIENWNFHKNEENYKRRKKKNSKSPQPGNKRTQHHKSDSIAIKRVRKSIINSDNKEREYYAQTKNEIVNDFKVEPQDSTKRKILCKYYAGGECKNGANCLFMHEDFPCKFFHDKALICRAGDGCKYSHAPLTEDMKLVMDCFIQEGKEYKATTTTPSSVPTYNTMTPVHNRIKCLLPTPTIINPILPINQNLNENMSILSGQEFNNDMSLNYNQNHVSNFKTRFIDPSLRSAHPPLLQRPRLPPINDFHHRFPMNNFQRAQPEFYNNDNSFIPVTNSTGQMYSDISRNDKYNQDAFCVKPDFIPHPEINITQPPPSCDIRSNQQINAPQTNSYNNHAPARFIVGLNNQSNFSKPPETNKYYDFKDELKKLADQIISQPCEEMPLSPEISNNTIDSEKSPRNDNDDKVQEEQIAVDNQSKTDEALSPKEVKENTETPSVRIAQNTSIFNINENELSESDKQYFNEMRNMINLEAQFESKTPWVAIKLERIEKQPYILFNLKIEEVHESATLDPRLTGHPVLRLIENQNEDPDEETVDQYPKNHSRVGVGDSDDDDDDDDDSSQGQLNIDMSQPQCDTRSYLYDCKFKRKKVSEQIML